MCHIFRSNLPPEGNQLNSSSSSSSLRKYQLSDFGIGTQFLHCLPLTSEELFTYSSLLQSSLQMHLTGFFRRFNLFLSFACSIQLLAVHFLVVYGQLARVSVFGGTTLFGTLYTRVSLESNPLKAGKQLTNDLSHCFPSVYGGDCRVLLWRRYLSILIPLLIIMSAPRRGIISHRLRVQSSSNKFFYGFEFNRETMWFLT